MQETDGELKALTPEESWRAINTTMDRARNSMHVAGTTTILLLWGHGFAGTCLPVHHRDAGARFLGG